MNLEAIGLSKSTGRELVESFLHRLLSLEIELKQLYRENSINKKQYTKKMNLIKNVQDKISKYQKNDEEKNRSFKEEASPNHIPDLQSRSPEETALCIKYFENMCEKTSVLLDESKEVVKILQATLKGRMFTFLAFLDLSKLRKQMLNLDHQKEALQHKKIKWDQFIEEVLNKTRLVSLSGYNQSKTQMLKNYFFELEQLHKEIVSLSLESERIEDDLNLKENWLSFQEWRITHQDVSIDT